MRSRSLLLVALATAGIGLAFAQVPSPAPVAKPAALSDNLPIPDAPAPATSKAWLIMDYATGQVLAGENVDTPVEPASITKVMTSYVIAAEMAAGKVKASQKVSQAARGVQIGVGSAAEEIATTDLMKEADMLTINANATRQAWAARMQATGYASESLMQGTSAESLSPASAAFSSLLTSAAAVAPQWYRRKV